MSLSRTTTREPVSIDAVIEAASERDDLDARERRLAQMPGLISTPEDLRRIRNTVQKRNLRASHRGRYKAKSLQPVPAARRVKK